MHLQGHYQYLPHYHIRLRYNKGLRMNKTPNSHQYHEMDFENIATDKVTFYLCTVFLDR